MRIVDDDRAWWVCDDCGEPKRPTVTFRFHGGFEESDVMLCGACLANGLQLIQAKIDEVRKAERR